MGYAEVNLSRLAVAGFKKLLGAKFETIDPRRALSQQSTWFVHDENGAVFEQDVGRWEVGGHGFRDSGFGIRVSGFGIRDSGFGIRVSG